MFSSNRFIAATLIAIALPACDKPPKVEAVGAPIQDVRIGEMPKAVRASPVRSLDPKRVSLKGVTFLGKERSALISIDRQPAENLSTGAPVLSAHLVEIHAAYVVLDDNGALLEIGMNADPSPQLLATRPQDSAKLPDSIYAGTSSNPNLAGKGNAAFLDAVENARQRLR